MRKDNWIFLSLTKGIELVAIKYKLLSSEQGGWTNSYKTIKHLFRNEISWNVHPPSFISFSSPLLKLKYVLGSQICVIGYLSVHHEKILCSQYTLAKNTIKLAFTFLFSICLGINYHICNNYHSMYHITII